MDQLAYKPIVWRLPNYLRFDWFIYVFALAVMIVSWLFLRLGGYDWRMAFAPAARNWWIAPWQTGSLILPWGDALLSPLATMPDRVASVLTNGLTVFVFAALARRFGAPQWLSLILLISPMGYFLFVNGQIDFLIWIGLLFFNGLDVVLITIKPQVALGVLVPRLRRAGPLWWRYLIPIVVVGILSIVIWGNWFVAFLSMKPPTIANYGVFPWGIVVGLPILYYAFRTLDDRWGIIATPFLMPFVNIQSWLAMMLALASFKPRWALAIWALTWIFGLVSFFVFHQPGR